MREVNARVCFAGRDDRRRAVLVNLDELMRTLMDDDLPQPIEVEPGYRRLD